MVRKKTIAYLTRQIDDNVGNQIWAGVVQRAKELDVNVFAFVGGVLGKHDSNIVYQLCDKKICDGIITWATSDTDYIDYYNRFKGIPMVTLSLDIAGFPSVSIDSYSGMKDALLHLIKEHNFTKIAFIRGPEHHVYAQQRYKAYLDVHREFNIKIDERKVTPPGTWEKESGIEAINYFIVQNKLRIPDDIQAIVGANDYLVIGAAEELKKRGYKVPGDVSVIGFNNTPHAESFTPPVTSVAMPYFEQGEHALEAICKVLNGEKIDQRLLLKSQLILHRSCGCKSESVTGISTNVATVKFEKCLIERFHIRGRIKLQEKEEKNFDDIKQDVIETIKSRVLFFLKSRNEVSQSFDEIVTVLSNKFVDSFLSSLDNENNELFLNSIEEILLFLAEYECNIEAWHGAISILRDAFNATNRIVEKYLFAQDLFEQARVVVSEVVRRVHILRNLEDNKKLQLIRNIGAKLITTFDINKLIDVLIDGLKRLDFPSFYVALFEKPFRYNFPSPIPEKANLVLAYVDGKILSKNSEEVFNTDELIPEKYKIKDRSTRFAVLPLYFDKKQMGYMLLELGPLEKYIYGAISEQLSSAFMGSFLMKEREKTEIFLEETIDALQKKAIVVSENSSKISQRVDDVSAAVEEIAANIRQISSRTEEVLNVVKESVNMVKNANDVISGLNEKTDKISSIILMINDIAEKTNILALNANIEAARAREYGKGFKIVANEVKKLSVLTVKSTEEIKSVISAIQDGSKSSHDIIVNAVNVINKVFDLTDAIKDAVSQQVTATNDVANKLMDTAYGSKEIFEAIKELSSTGSDVDGGATLIERIRRMKDLDNN